MSVVKFELKEEHVKLLRNLRWSKNDKNLIVNVSEDEESVPFGEDNIYEAIDLILNGRPENFDPFETHEPIEYSDEQKAEWDKLYEELPLALDVILYNQNFDLGQYKTKYHDRNWKKMN
jgi:hypothetical protein